MHLHFPKIAPADNTQHQLLAHKASCRALVSCAVLLHAATHTCQTGLPSTTMLAMRCVQALCSWKGIRDRNASQSAILSKVTSICGQGHK